MKPIVNKKKASLNYNRQFCFDKWNQEIKNKAYKFAESYKKFVSQNKTEREVVETLTDQLLSRGFKQINFTQKVSKKWQKLFLVNRHKALIMAIQGKQSTSTGVNIIVSHLDSPRLDLKLTPVYQKEHLAYFKTHYYGGIKTYQWTAIPLEIRGMVVTDMGKQVPVSIGAKQNDPIFMVSDLLPHLAEKQMELKLKEAIKGEDLNLLVGSISSVKKSDNRVKDKVLELLNKKYGIKEEDLISADLEIVPNGLARDVGFDASMISAYGQDDRVCAYTSFQSAMDIGQPEKTTILIFVDREEIGSYGNTGALSSFSKDFIASLLAGENLEFNENTLRDCLASSSAISADVTTAIDPNFATVSDSVTAVRMGAGVVIEKYTGGRGKGGSNEASAEYMAKMRQILNSNSQIVWQPASGIGKVDFRGGGTVALFFSQHNIDVVDMGVALFNMHAPFEISHKGDIYSAYLAFKQFLG
ncbi:aminopeptidase [Candidatus Shapirobacteria bacterium]|nr:MAG: aminopeptidase [Candidatus Shapirobacteria bacterium]